MTPYFRQHKTRLAAGLGGLALLLTAVSAQAGIDVRAPFTHVGVDRDHGVSVRAPFTHVQVGHGRYRHDERRGWHDRHIHHRGYYHDRGYHYAHRDHDRRDWHDHEPRHHGLFGLW